MSDPAKGPRPRSRKRYHVGNLQKILLDVALAELEAVGPARLSLREVSARAGVSVAAAYNHFESRGDLLSQLAASGFNELTQAVREASGKAAAGDKLRAAFYAYFGFARKRPALYQLMFGPELAFGQATRVLREASETSFAGLRAVVAQDFSLSDQSKQLNRATLAAWSLGHGLAALVTQSELHLPEGLPDERLVDQVLQGASLLFAPRP